MLSAFRPEITPSIIAAQIESQCTFWCSVLSDYADRVYCHLLDRVSMHLLVLSAFRQYVLKEPNVPDPGLNAPFGAQCFPTQKGGGQICRRF